ncbi:ABC transporter substrate-binding protein [Parafrankia sp. BMG5.11]|uniref:ABC transporter substrate-binding protein n=1 Tax=Parafrankia sp. BMG5.11 TaxID=222540 RepID=UPI00103CC368|nr:ABC transporter substrate-binding protein [Parafrankia sp. BMG5.11]TCJ35290.1 ABC transporter substrate-binding protein [Parafrankia sp. BMG5.11]CAI7980487.1 osmoprotectant transport system substrate-binding protein [Frankia sp. Hr75.2]
MGSANVSEPTSVAAEAGQAVRRRTRRTRRIRPCPRRAGRRRVGAAAAAMLALALTTAACGDGSGGASLGSLTVADAGFTESKILADMYGELLTNAGYKVERTSVQSTEIAQSSLESGQIDAMPQYVATYADLLNSQVNGSGAASVSSSDLNASLAGLRRLAKGLGLSVLEPADAVDQNAFAVSRSFAAEHHLTTLTDLGASGLTVKLAAGAECATRPFCQPGLEKTYGIEISEIVETGVATAQTKAAVRDNTAQLGLVLTTDATVNDYNLVVLTDDKKLQNADNLVPIVNTDSLAPEITSALNALAPVLTTADLAELNKRVDAEREKSEEVAHDFLAEKGLLDS